MKVTDTEVNIRKRGKERGLNRQKIRHSKREIDRCREASIKKERNKQPEMEVDI